MSFNVKLLCVLSPTSGGSCRSCATMGFFGVASSSDSLELKETLVPCCAMLSSHLLCNVFFGVPPAFLPRAIFATIATPSMQGSHDLSSLPLGLSL